MKRALPPGLEELTVSGVPAFADPVARSWVVATLEKGWTLHQAASSDPDARMLRGRGPVPVVPAPEGHWVVRHYWRGGAMAPLLGDRYLNVGEPRPVSEARWAYEAERRAVPTPAVVAGAIYRAGPFYRADIVTEYVPRSRDLAAVLFDDGPEPDAGPDEPAWSELRADALAAARELVILAAEAGLFHPDLNAMNILLSRAPGTVDPWMVDLDRCRLDVAGPDLVESAMLGRLERSLRKLEASTGRPLPAEEWRILRTGTAS